MACTALVDIVATCQIKLARTEFNSFVGPHVGVVRKHVEVLVTEGLHMGLPGLLHRPSKVECSRVVQL